jgi:transcriptional regulator with XRE-family HTH domain
VVEQTLAKFWIGPQLKKLRVLQDRRARDVARGAGLSKELLSHIETGRRPVTPDRVGRILAAIGGAPAAECEGQDAA